MGVSDWLQEANELLNELSRIDFGYPLGANVVPPQQKPSAVAQILGQLGLDPWPEIREFYCLCDGISWPDVHVGYFMKPLARLAEVKPDSEPRRIVGTFSDEVVTIGSTSGGGLFVLARTAGQIFHLPPGALHSGVYEDERLIKQIASDFSEFLEALLKDLAAFVTGTPAHRFMAD
jgi:hypothetical protein